MDIKFNYRQLRLLVMGIGLQIHMGNQLSDDLREVLTPMVRQFGLGDYEPDRDDEMFYGDADKPVLDEILMVVSQFRSAVSNPEFMAKLTRPGDMAFDIEEVDRLGIYVTEYWMAA